MCASEGAYKVEGSQGEFLLFDLGQISQELGFHLVSVFFTTESSYAGGGFSFFNSMHPFFRRVPFTDETII